MGNIIFACLYKCCTNMAHNVKGGEKLTMLQSRDLRVCKTAKFSNNQTWIRLETLKIIIGYVIQ